ncbi:methyltransferase domain-containing protein [bacterium]|nr:methyltransferase domain-containing protein [bacterium]
MSETEAERLEYSAVNQPVLALIPRDAQRILDLGCGVGALGQEIKRQQSAEVVGITISSVEGDRASLVLDRVIVQDLDNFDPSGLGTFDCVVCSHVLEHLRHPEDVLISVRSLLSASGCVVVALPNVLVWRQRLQFLFGRFRYTNGGLMDHTHLQFFDHQTAQNLVTSAGFQLETVKADGGFPLSRFLPGIGRWLDQIVLTALPGLFGWQVVMRAKPESGVR